MGIDTELPVLALMRSAGGIASPALSICALVASHLFGLEQRWASTEPEVSMRIREERRAELRADLHRLWTVSVESELLGQRRAQVLDYSASGMRLAIDGNRDLFPGATVAIHYPGTGWSYQATITWATNDGKETVCGVQLKESACSMRQSCLSAAEG